MQREMDKPNQPQAQPQQTLTQNTDSQVIRESNKVDPDVFKKFTYGNLEGPRWALAENCKGTKPKLNVTVFRTTSSCQPPEWNVGNFTGGSCRNQSPFSAYATSKESDKQQPIEWMMEINGVELVKLDGQEVVKISFERFTRGRQETERRVSFFKFENNFQYMLWATKSSSKDTWDVKEGKDVATGSPTKFIYFNCESNSPELIAAKKVIRSNPEVLKDKANTLLNYAGILYFNSKTYDMQKKQWDFNVKYGAPPVSENFTKLVKKDFPETYRIFGACSKRLGGQDINNETVEKYAKTSNDEQIVQMRKLMQFASEMGEAPVRVPLRKDLNSAADAEIQMRAPLNLFDKVLNFRTDKDWCQKLIDMDW